MRRGEAGLDLSKEHLRTQELEQRGQLRIPSAFPSSGEGSGGGVRPLSRHHVGNRPALPLDLKEDTPSQPSLVTGISWGCLRVVDGNAGTVSSFPARTTVARHDRFCLQVLAWLVRPCGFDACPSCVSSSLVHAAPGSQARVKPKAAGGGEAGLDLSKEHLRTQELEQRGQLRIPSAFPSSGRGQGEEYAPLSRHHVGNRPACR